MADSYVLKVTENEYLLVIRAEDAKAIYLVIDALSASRNEQIKEVAIELEKSLHDNGRDSSKAGSKNKSKTATSNDSKRRKAKNT